jgi:[acyl-carrier-protein] S-malonyltransferase
MYSFIFPGQGTQKVGMGQSLYSTSQAARSVFKEADDSLGVSLTQVMFEGPSETLQDTAFAQPAIMTVSIAIWRAWQEFLGASAPQPSAVAGHSLGEYTSMVVGGVMDFSDGIRLVRERGRLMHEASEARPGSMAAIIGLDEIVVAQVAQDAGVEMANINSDDQIVISGDKMALARAMDLASARGAKKSRPVGGEWSFPFPPHGFGPGRAH